MNILTPSLFSFLNLPWQLTFLSRSFSFAISLFHKCKIFNIGILTYSLLDNCLPLVNYHFLFFDTLNPYLFFLLSWITSWFWSYIFFDECVSHLMHLTPSWFVGDIAKIHCSLFTYLFIFSLDNQHTIFVTTSSPWVLFWRIHVPHYTPPCFPSIVTLNSFP